MCYTHFGDCMNVIKCSSFKDKLIGLMFKKNIDYALAFKKCSSIHTFFMREPIDVVMTDKSGNIIYKVTSLPPFKVILPKKNVYYTFEFPNKFTLNNNINSIIKENLF